MNKTIQLNNKWERTSGAQKMVCVWPFLFHLSEQWLGGYRCSLRSRSVNRNCESECSKLNLLKKQLDAHKIVAELHAKNEKFVQIPVQLLNWFQTAISFGQCVASSQCDFCHVHELLLRSIRKLFAFLRKCVGLGKFLSMNWDNNDPVAADPQPPKVDEGSHALYSHANETADLPIEVRCPASSDVCVKCMSWKEEIGEIWGKLSYNL